MTSILIVTTAIEQKLQEILNRQTEARVYLKSQNYASYPCYVVRIKEAKILPTLPSSYEINFQVILLSHNEFDLTNLLENALSIITKDNLKLNSEIKNVETLGTPSIPTTLEVFNLECNAVNWGQGQDLISASVAVDYTCSIIHKITEEELLRIEDVQPLFT